jgi:hypothetical protein
MGSGWIRRTLFTTCSSVGAHPGWEELCRIVPSPLSPTRKCPALEDPQWNDLALHVVF